MTNTEKIVNKTKEYILNLYAEGYSEHKNMVLGLKNGIDFFVGQESSDIEKLKSEIKATCLNEFQNQTKNYQKNGHLKMIGRIKLDFINYITNLKVEEIELKMPLEFERRLRRKETGILIDSLKFKFDFDSWSANSDTYYWEPLAKTNTKLHVMHFDDALFQQKEIDSLIEIITSLSGNRIYMLTEDNYQYEIDVKLVNLDMIESAYCDKLHNWLIYHSHEGTIAFSGATLIDEMKIKLNWILEYKDPWG